VKVPLADAIAAATLGEIHVDVVLMIPVRAGTEYRRKARADGRFHREAEILRYGGVGRVHHFSIFEPERANVERVRPPVLAQPGARDAVLAAAFERIVILDPVEPRAELRSGGDEIVADPGHDRLRRLAAKRGGRRDRDWYPVLRDDALQRDDVRAAAVARSGYLPERREAGTVWGETELAGGGRHGGLEPEFTGGFDGIELRRARARQRGRLRRRASADHDTDCRHCRSELHIPCIGEYRGLFKGAGGPQPAD
jgi:hypothetical protein